MNETTQIDRVEMWCCAGIAASRARSRSTHASGRVDELVQAPERRGGDKLLHSLRRWASTAISLHLAFGVAVAACAAPPAAGPEAPFLAENQIAMDKMMTGMDIRPSGDVDQDFAAMMIPHHQGAIDMAVAELRYGRNERLRRIAQEIIVEQQQEIAAMQLALGQQLTPSAAAAAQSPTPAAATPRSTAMPTMNMPKEP